MKKSPCLGCEFRHIGCHAECVKFLDFQQKRGAEREEIRRQKHLDSLTTFSQISYPSRRRMSETQRMAKKARPERPSQKD